MMCGKSPFWLVEWPNGLKVTILWPLLYCGRHWSLSTGWEAEKTFLFAPLSFQEDCLGIHQRKAMIQLNAGYWGILRIGGHNSDRVDVLNRHTQVILVLLSCNTIVSLLRHVLNISVVSCSTCCRLVQLVVEFTQSQRSCVQLGLRYILLEQSTNTRERLRFLKNS